MTERVRKVRAAYLAWQQQVDASKIICIDEAGCNDKMTRRVARSVKGARAIDHVPGRRGQSITLIGALSLQGIEAMITGEGGTTSEVWRAFVKQALIPVLKPGQIVVVDNLSSHKDKMARKMIEDAGCTLRFQPPYSPEMNPIELAWSKMKQFLGVAKARCREALDTAVAMACEMITPSDAAGWFRVSGFTNQ